MIVKRSIIRLNKKLVKKFATIFILCMNLVMEILINFFFLRKGVYLYEYMDSRERFDETSLPDKNEYYSSLNMKNITYVYEDIEDVYEDIPDDAEKWFGASNYEVNRPFPTSKNKKVIALMKGELGEKIKT